MGKQLVIGSLKLIVGDLSDQGEIASARDFSNVDSLNSLARFPGKQGLKSASFLGSGVVGKQHGLSYYPKEQLAE